jgi:Protein of unknown function (DUF3309)
MLTIVLVVVVLMLLGAMPTWPHSRGWGYYPSGGLRVVGSDRLDAVRPALMNEPALRLSRDVKSDATSFQSSPVRWSHRRRVNRLPTLHFSPQVV